MITSKAVACFGVSKIWAKDTARAHEALAEIDPRLNADLVEPNVGLVDLFLDELLELSDRILVISKGRIVYETPIADADRQTIGTHMAAAAPLGSTSGSLNA